MNETFAPAPCQPKISSFGPQCVVEFQTHVVGPPSGKALLLMARTTVDLTAVASEAPVPVTPLGEPFTPKPLSASIQRQKQRLFSLLGMVPEADPIGSG